MSERLFAAATADVAPSAAQRVGALARSRAQNRVDAAQHHHGRERIACGRSGDDNGVAGLQVGDLLVRLAVDQGLDLIAAPSASAATHEAAARSARSARARSTRSAKSASATGAASFTTTAAAP